MNVCIAEKPSVAREIATILGANTKKDGYYEGNGYAVTYTFGHLCTLLEPKDYKPHWKSWDLNNLPMLPERFTTKVTNDSGIKKQFIRSAFVQANPGAFRSQNPNWLLAGKEMRIPTAQDILALIFVEAPESTSKSTRNWIKFP